MAQPSIPADVGSVLSLTTGPHPDRSAECGICLEDVGLTDNSVEHTNNLLEDQQQLPGQAGCRNRWHCECILPYLDFQKQSCPEEAVRCPLCRSLLLERDDLEDKEGELEGEFDIESEFDLEDDHFVTNFDFDPIDESGINNYESNPSEQIHIVPDLKAIARILGAEQFITNPDLPYELIGEWNLSDVVSQDQLSTALIDKPTLNSPDEDQTIWFYSCLGVDWKDMKPPSFPQHRFFAPEVVPFVIRDSYDDLLREIGEGWQGNPDGARNLLQVPMSKEHVQRLMQASRPSPEHHRRLETKLDELALRGALRYAVVNLAGVKTFLVAPWPNDDLVSERYAVPGKWPRLQDEYGEVWRRRDALLVDGLDNSLQMQFYNELMAQCRLTDAEYEALAARY